VITLLIARDLSCEEFLVLKHLDHFDHRERVVTRLRDVFATQLVGLEFHVASVAGHDRAGRRVRRLLDLADAGQNGADEPCDVAERTEQVLLRRVMRNDVGDLVPDDGRELVFHGKPADPASTSAPRLHILDLQSGETRPIGPDFPSGFTSSGIGGLGLAVNPIDRSVLVDMRDGDLHQVVSVPSDGKGTSRVLLTLTQGSWGLDVTTNGTLFVDQVSRPVEIVRFRESDTAPTPIAVVHSGMPSALELPDRGILITTSFNGRSRLSVVKPDKEIVPFVDTADETREPLAFAGPHQVARDLAFAAREDARHATQPRHVIDRRLDCALISAHDVGFFGSHRDCETFIPDRLHGPVSARLAGPRARGSVPCSWRGWSSAHWPGRA
jgi:hypothetical protein